MIQIIVGTNRPNSRSLEIAKVVQSNFASQNINSEVMEIEHLPLNKITGTYGDDKPQGIVDAVEKLNQADGLLIVCPEYNGSYPGALKYFIDHWKYPDTFQHKPVAFIGLGGQWGGLRPVEHLQQVFGYRNGYVFPDRVFIQDVWTALKDGQLQNEKLDQKVQELCQNFPKFIRALKDQGLHPN